MDGTMEIRSTEQILEAMEYTNQLAERLGLLPGVQLQLRLVTEESITNALEYGKNGSALVGWQVSCEEVVISVRQQGERFPIEVSNTINYSSHGRGLQLISAIMDEVWLTNEEDSLTLWMKKRFRQ